MATTRPTRCAEAGAAARHRLRRLAVAIGIAVRPRRRTRALAQTVKLTPGRRARQLTWTDNVNLAPDTRGQRPRPRHHAQPGARLEAPRHLARRHVACRLSVRPHRRAEQRDLPAGEPGRRGRRSSRTSSSSTRRDSCSRPTAPVRAAAGRPDQRDGQPRHVAALPDQPVHPGRDRAATSTTCCATTAAGPTWTARRVDTSNSYTNRVVRHDRPTPAAPLGWGADIDRSAYSSTTRIAQRDQRRARRAALRLGSRRRAVSAHVGYEDNRYPLSDYGGADLRRRPRWRPTERTSVVANWEHRFFGSSYLFTFDHRTPLSVWNVQRVAR